MSASDGIRRHQTIREAASSVTNQTTPDTTTDTSDTRSGERNKAVCRRWIEDFNARNDAGEAGARGQGYVAYAPKSIEPTPMDSEAWTGFLSGFVEAFSDLHITVEDAV